jgi:hypothetical protein
MRRHQRLEQSAMIWNPQVQQFMRDDWKRSLSQKRSEANVIVAAAEQEPHFRFIFCTRMRCGRTLSLVAHRSMRCLSCS